MVIIIAEEKNFENKIKKWLKDHGCWYVKYWSDGRFTQNGIPDILACVGGFLVGIEVKASNGKPSDLQLYNIRSIRKSGGYAWVVYPSGWEILQAFLINISSGLIFPMSLMDESEKEILK